MEKKGTHKKTIRLIFIAMALFTFAVVCAIIFPESEFATMWLIGFPATVSIFFWGAAVIYGIYESVQAKKNQGEEVVEGEENAEQENAEERPVKVCKYCGTENDIEDRKCHTCGAGLKRTPKNKKANQ